MRLEMRDAPEHAAGDEVFDCKKVAVPSTIVKDRQHALPAGCQVDELIRLGERQREGLVHDHVLAGQQGVAGQREVGVVGRGHDHEVDVRAFDQGPRRIEDLERRPIGPHLGFIAARHGFEHQARNARDQRCVESLGGKAVAEDADADGVKHGVNFGFR